MMNCPRQTMEQGKRNLISGGPRTGKNTLYSAHCANSYLKETSFTSNIGNLPHPLLFSCTIIRGESFLRAAYDQLGANFG